MAPPETNRLIKRLIGELRPISHMGPVWGCLPSPDSQSRGKTSARAGHPLTGFKSPLNAPGRPAGTLRFWPGAVSQSASRFPAADGSRSASRFPEADGSQSASRFPAADGSRSASRFPIGQPVPGG